MTSYIGEVGSTYCDTLGETKGGEGVNEYIILHDVINGYYLNLIYFQRGKKIVLYYSTVLVV